MLQKAILCPDWKILHAVYDGQFLRHWEWENECFIDWWDGDLYRYWWEWVVDISISERMPMHMKVNNLVLITIFWTELMKDLSYKDLELRRISKVFPEWIAECIEHRLKHLPSKL